MAIASVIRNRNEEYANLLKRHSSSEKRLENLLSTKETEIQSAKQRYASEIAEINSRLSSDTKAARTKQERQISTAVGVIEDEKRRLQDRISVLQASAGAVHERKLREAKDQRDNAFLAHRRALESQRQSAEESYQNGLNRITAERAAADQRQADELAQQDRMRLERIELLKHRRNECRRAVEKELAQYKSEIKSFLTRSHGRSRLTHQSDALLKATREYYSVVDNISRLNAGANAPTPRTDATADNERRRELERQRDTALEAAQIAYDNAIEASRREYEDRRSALVMQKADDLRKADALREKIEKLDADIARERAKNGDTSAIDCLNRIAADEKEKVERERENAISELTKERDDIKNKLKEQRQRNKEALDRFLAEAKEELDEILGRSCDYTVGSSDLSNRSELPERICIGETVGTTDGGELASVLYGRRDLPDNTPVFLEVRQSGNIVINATSNDRNSDELNRIVCGLTLKCMEEFPLGSLKVHFVDPSSCTWFNYFENEFGRQKSPVCKQLITNDTELIGRLDEVNTQDVAMVLRRLGANQDLYDLYKTDKTRYFHLFVIRNGFYNFAGGNSTAKLLPLLAERGRKSGVRFIIVNDYDESKSEHERNAKKQFLADVYEKSMTLDFENGNVRFGGESLNVSRVVSDDPELFIEQRCELMAGVLNGRDEVIIPYEEIGFDRHSGVNKNSCVLSIPVAKVGNDIMEIVLNCGDEREGPANTGYVAMGTPSSGKTSFYHSLVINGARKYSPRDLEFWLLDFKENGASSNYLNAKIPHIKLLSLDSKVGDALCLFGLLVDEMTRRAEILNEVGLATRGTTFSNLNEYNEYVDNHPERGEHMSRIVVVIDEIQEIFNSKNASNDEINAITALINSISLKSRFVGIHMVIIVQNLSGRTHVLQESFIRNVKGRIMFQLDEGFVNESGYGDGFKRMSSAIRYLRQGEAYATNNASNPDKVKMAYCHPSKFESYFGRIREKHGSETKMRLIGNKKALLSTDNVSGTNTPYTELLSKPEVFKLYNKNGYGIVYGEDAYTLNPVKFTFNSSISSVVALGSDERLMSSICTSLLVGISHLPRKQIYVCNGLGIDEMIFNGAVASCQGTDGSVRRFKKSEIDQLVKEIYIEYLRRRRVAEDEIIEDNAPIFAVINDLISIDKVTNDYRYPAAPVTAPSNGANNNFSAMYAAEYNLSDFTNALKGMTQSVPTAPAAPAAEDPIANKTISSVIDELCQKGSAFGIYFNFSTRDLGNKFVELFKKTTNKVVFNSYTDNVSDGNYPTYLVRAILNDIQNPTKIGETAAASLFGGKVSKVRPIIHQN